MAENRIKNIDESYDDQLNKIKKINEVFLNELNVFIVTYSNYFLIQDKKQLSNILYYANLSDNVININKKEKEILLYSYSITQTFIILLTILYNIYLCLYIYIFNG